MNTERLKFLTRPQDAVINKTTGKAAVTWETNFFPKKIEIGYNELDSNWNMHWHRTIQFNPGTQTLFTREFPAEVRPWYEVHAFYGNRSDDYIAASFAVKDPGYVFTFAPVDAVIPPDQNSFEVSWSTNFTPTRTVIVRNPADENPVRVYESVYGTSAVLDVSGLDTAVYQLRAYHDEDYSGGCLKRDFTITRTAFTSQPRSASHAVGGYASVSWETNFSPQRIRLVRVTDSGETEVDRTIDASVTGCDLQTWADEDITQYRLRAWWGSGANDYVSSSPFHIVRRRFVVQPAGGYAVSVNGGFTASWQTSFVPSAFEYLALRDGEYISVHSLTGVRLNDDGTASVSLAPHQGGRLGTTYIIRAYAFDGGSVDSAPFDVINPVTFRVFFRLNGVQGTGTAAQDVIHGQPAVRPEDPVAAGYDFRGWFTDAAATHPYDFSTPVTEMTVLYAGWTRYCIVTFERGATGVGVGGINPDSQTVLSGRTAEDPYADGMSTADFAFIGWTTDEAGRQPYFNFANPVMQDMTLYSQWRPLRCYVTTHANGYGYDHIYHVNIGESFPEPDIPETWQYTHMGWYTDAACTHEYDFSQPVTGDLDLYNCWVENPVVTIMLNDGTDDYYRVRTGYGAAPELSEPEKAGYTFLGWFEDAELATPFDNSAPLYSDVTVFAGWSVINYTVSFDSQGGSQVPSQSIPYGGRVVRPEDPTRSGFVFYGWYSEPDCVSFFSFGYYNPDHDAYDFSYQTVTGAMTIYARWIPEGVAVDEINFPNMRFRNFVSEHYDGDGNGYLSDQERTAVTKITVSNTQITDFTGVNYFTEVTELDVSHATRKDTYTLETLDVSGMTKLKKLFCSNCNLASLNLYNNRELTVLYSRGNSLTELDLTSNTALEKVYVNDCFDLTSLKVVGDITALECYKTGLGSLDLLGCPGLLRAVTEGTLNVAMSWNQYSIKQGDVTYYIQVNKEDQGATSLVTDGIPIDEEHFPDAGFRRTVRRMLDGNGNGWLTPDEREATYLGLRSGDIRNLQGIEYFPELTELAVPISMLEEADLSGCSHLRKVNLHSNLLTTLDVSMLTELTNLDVSDNPMLTGLTLGDAPIEILNCAGCEKLHALDLSGQLRLLKAYMDGSQTAGEDTVVYLWTEDSMGGRLQTDTELRPALPAWEWRSPDDAAFILPNGREERAEVSSSCSADGGTVDCAASVTLQGVTFMDENATFRKVSFAETEEPDQWVKEGATAERPEDPSRAGSLFVDWRLSPEALSAYDFTTPVTTPFTLYPNWFTPEPRGILRLPADLAEIGSQTFAGIDAEAVVILSTVTHIADDAFDDSNVQYIYGCPGSEAESFAATKPFLRFVPVDDDWQAGG